MVMKLIKSPSYYLNNVFVFWEIEKFVPVGCDFGS